MLLAEIREELAYLRGAAREARAAIEESRASLVDAHETLRAANQLLACVSPNGSSQVIIIGSPAIKIQCRRRG